MEERETKPWPRFKKKTIKYKNIYRKLNIGNMNLTETGGELR